MALQLMGDDDRFPVRDSELGVVNGDPDTVYTLRPITRETVKAILKVYQKTRPNPRTHAMETYFPDGAQEKANEDLLDHALVAWEGIEYAGEPAPCTREYKLKLDAQRLLALIDRAGLTQAKAGASELAESFRGPA